MDAKFRTRLITAAVAALFGTAALAQSGVPEYSTMTIRPISDFAAFEPLPEIEPGPAPSSLDPVSDGRAESLA